MEQTYYMYKIFNVWIFSALTVIKFNFRLIDYGCIGWPWPFPFEPAHDETYNKTCATSEDSDQPAHPGSLIRVFTDCMCLLQLPGYPKRDEREPLPYWVDVQADLSLCWSHRSYCRFYLVLAHLYMAFVTWRCWALVPLSVVHLTADQEVASSNQLVHIIFVEIDHETICMVILTLLLIQEGQLSVPVSVAQLDAPSDWRPGGRGFNPRRGRQHSFVEIDHKIFSTVILSLPLIQEGQLSVSGERMCTILVNRLED